jgi:hypothetical protein
MESVLVARAVNSHQNARCRRGDGEKPPFRKKYSREITEPAMGT